MSKKAKFTRIVLALDSAVFEKKAEMKWNTVSNEWDWLEGKYHEQTKRFKMTGEGPTDKEEFASAKNLFGTIIPFLLTVRGRPNNVPLLFSDGNNSR